jgi:hypothetical protein
MHQMLGLDCGKAIVRLSLSARCLRSNDLSTPSPEKNATVLDSAGARAAQPPAVVFSLVAFASWLGVLLSL